MITNSLDRSHKFLSDNIYPIHERKDGDHILSVSLSTYAKSDLQRWPLETGGDSSGVGNAGFPRVGLVFERVLLGC